MDSEAHVPTDWRNPDLKLYHGTIRAYAESIALKGVDLGLARNDSDFGRGFYTTTLWRQAAEWARYRYVRLSENEQADPAYAPAVVAYSVQREALAGMDALWFVRGAADAEDYWTFVAYCRQQHPNAEGDHGRPLDKSVGKYDIVSGPVANVWRERSAFADYDQISFHTAQALTVLAEPIDIQTVLSS